MVHGLIQFELVHKCSVISLRGTNQELHPFGTAPNRTFLGLNRGAVQVQNHTTASLVARGLSQLPYLEGAEILCRRF
jgi:hypothetical protein